MPNIKSLLFGDREEEWSYKRESENIIVGYGYKKFSKPPVIGKNPLLRSNTVIYNDVTIGDNLRTGHNVLIREKTTIGDDVLAGRGRVHHVTAHRHRQRSVTLVFRRGTGVDKCRGAFDGDFGFGVGRSKNAADDFDLAAAFLQPKNALYLYIETIELYRDRVEGHNANIVFF